LIQTEAGPAPIFSPLRYDVPMTPEQRATATQVLYMNMIDYWYEVDMKGGAGVVLDASTGEEIFRSSAQGLDLGDRGGHLRAWKRRPESTVCAKLRLRRANAGSWSVIDLGPHVPARTTACELRRGSA
jgi:hypothetical protein